MIDITAVFHYYFIASKEFAFGFRRIFSAPPASNALPICKLLPAAFSLPGRRVSRRKREHSPFRCDGRSEQPSVRRRIFSAPPASNALPICKLLPAAFFLSGRRISRRKRGHSPFRCEEGRIWQNSLWTSWWLSAKTAGSSSPAARSTAGSPTPGTTVLSAWRSKTTSRRLGGRSSSPKAPTTSAWTAPS